MSRSWTMFLALGVATVALSVSLPAISPSSSPAPSIELTGTVMDSDGQLMEGVTVSARAEGTPITTSVWTDQDGAYAFPVLDGGRYSVWAQAVGFDRPVAEATIATGTGLQHDFTLAPLPNVMPQQLSTAEWLARLPDDTSTDRRMKMVVLNQCTNCHLPANWLEKRFDAASWETMFDYMERIAPDGDVPTSSAGDPPGRGPAGITFAEGELDANGDPISVHTKLMRFYREDLVEYLTKVAGPNPVPLKPEAFPRPTGIETQLVVTEYDLPSDRPRGGISQLDPRTGLVKVFTEQDGRTVSEDVPYVARNPYLTGEDWSWGTRENQRGSHDIALGSDGNVYVDGRSMSMDPARDTIWIGGNAFTSFDVKTQTLKSYPRVPTVMSHGVDVDTNGNAWGSTGLGAVRMNIETGEIAEFNTPTPDSRPYDIGVDSLNNVWLSQLAIDKMAVVDGLTGDVTEVAIPSYTSPDIRPEDIEIHDTVGSWDHNSALGQQGPRRMGADRDGNFVYAGLYWTAGIAQFDARTKTLVKVHQVPNGRFGQPYKPFPDKNHMVWFGLSADDRFGQLNPTTGKFTMYPLPSRGTNSRHLAVDNTTDIPTVWVPYTGIGKIARVQFRTDTSEN